MSKYQAVAVAGAVIFFAAGVLVLYAYQPHGIALFGVPSQAEWEKSIVSPIKTLSGTIVSVGQGTLILSGAQEGATDTTAIALHASTQVTKTVPMPSEEREAAFREFQARQATADGKPFEAPPASVVTTLTVADIQVGEYVLVTLDPSSTESNFTASRIEILSSL